jgi:hypothetical protein
MYLLALAVVFLALLFSPLYEQAFYAAGWERSRTWTEKDASGRDVSFTRSGKHTFSGDVSCIFHRVIEGDAGRLRNLCFAQGPRPATGSRDLRDRSTNILRTPTPTKAP